MSVITLQSTPAVAQASPPGRLGIWFFLASEAMFFVALIGSYLVLRAGQPELFAREAGHLNRLAASINTAVLLLSSVTMMFAVRASASGRQGKTILWLVFTLIFAAVFLAIKSMEYRAEWPMNQSVFHACYFTLTGAHILHFLGGVLPLLVLLIQAMRGKLLPTQTQYVGLYWFFVDAVWMVIFPLLYLS